MRNSLKLATIALACFTAIGVHAQTATVATPVLATATVASPVAELTLADCLALAATHQPDYQAALYNLQGSGSRMTESRASYLPTVTVQNNDLHIDDPSNKAGHGTSLQVTHTFYDSGLRDVRYDQAKASFSSDQAGLERTKQALDFNVTSAYLSLLRTQKLLNVSVKQLEYVQKQYDVLAKRVAVGDAARVDLYPLEAQLASSRVDKLNAENNIRKATVALQTVIGLPFTQELRIKDVNSKIVASASVDEYLVKAQAQRPELRQAKLNETTADLSLKAAKINRGPRLQVNGQYGMDIDNDMAHNWSIAGVISYSLFDGDLLKAKEDEAKSSKEATLQKSASTLNNVRSDVVNAYLNLQNAQERLDVTKLSLLAAQKNNDAQAARQLNGLGTNLDVINAAAQLASAESAAITAQYDYILALAQINYAIGLEGIKL